MTRSSHGTERQRRKSLYITILCLPIPAASSLLTLKPLFTSNFLPLQPSVCCQICVSLRGGPLMSRFWLESWILGKLNGFHLLKARASYVIKWKTLNGWLIWKALLVAVIILMVLELLGLLINRLDKGQMDDFKQTVSHDCLWFQWFCRPVLWFSTRSSSSMERSCRLITSSTGATGSAGGPPSSCWVEESSSACGQTYTRMQCTELSVSPLCSAGNT